MAKPAPEPGITEPESPVCGHCGSAALTRARCDRGKKRFLCRDCHRTSYGMPLPVYLCPYCKGKCFRNGHAPSGAQFYVCRGCGRYNRDLYPEAPRSPGGPFTHRMNLWLNTAARRNLIDYCFASGMSPVQAIRDIFRRASVSFAPIMARRVYEPGTDRSYIQITRAKMRPSPPPPPLGKIYLPNLRRETTRKRLAGGNRRNCPVGVVLAVTILLDDQAMRGLLRTMDEQKMTHQEAARHLITIVPPPRVR